MAEKVLLIASSSLSIIVFRFNLIKDLILKGYGVVVCSPVDNKTPEVVKKLSSLGVKFVPIVMHNTGLNLFYDLWTLWCLCKVVWQERPDYVLSFTIKPVIYGSLAAKFAKVPKIYSMITGLGYVFIGNSFKNKILRVITKILYKISLQCNNKVFFQNSADLQLFVDAKIIKKVKAVLINGSGVDINYYSVASFPPACIFIFIARLIRDKGIFEYLGAARNLKRIYPRAIFKIAGGLDSNPTSISESDLNKLREEGIVEYLGVLSDVRPALFSSSVFVLPSYREGTSKATLEAMATGRPIISTDAPGCRETVIDGLNGYLVPIKDVDRLTKAMENFILKPEMISKMGLESRRIAEEKYDVKKVNEVILKTMQIIKG